MKNRCSRLVTLAALGALALGLGSGSPASAGNARSDRTEITYQRWLRQQAMLNALWQLRFERLRELQPLIQQRAQENWARWRQMGLPLMSMPLTVAADPGAANPFPADPQFPEATSPFPSDPQPPVETGDVPAVPGDAPAVPGN